MNLKELWEELACLLNIVDIGFTISSRQVCLLTDCNTNLTGYSQKRDERNKVLEKFQVPMMPFLYHGPFSMDKVNEFVDGPTAAAKEEDVASKFKGREGIVIRPVKERYNFDLGGSGRVILKAVSVDYHDRKGKKTEFH